MSSFILTSATLVFVPIIFQSQLCLKCLSISTIPICCSPDGSSITATPRVNIIFTCVTTYCSSVTTLYVGKLLIHSSLRYSGVHHQPIFPFSAAVVSSIHCHFENFYLLYQSFGGTSMWMFCDTSALNWTVAILPIFFILAFMASLPELSGNITLSTDRVMDPIAITDTPSLIKFLEMCSLHSALKVVEYITKMDDSAAIKT